MWVLHSAGATVTSNGSAGGADSEREQSGIGWMRIVVSWPGESQPRTVSLSTIGRLSEGAGDAS